MKIKKIIAVLLLTLVITAASSTNVFAAQSVAYEQVELPAGGEIETPALTSGQNYRYVLHYVGKFENSGGAALHSKYYAVYDSGSPQVAGGDIKTTAVGAAVWKPANYTSNPAGWNVLGSKTCSSTHASTNYCALQGRKYKLFMENQNVLFRIRFYGQMTFTN